MNTESTPSLPRFYVVRDNWGHLCFIAEDGTEHAKVTAIPLFPVSEPDHWISIVSHTGEELMLIEKLEDLPIELRTIIKEELSFRELIPRIQKVLSVSGTTEPCEWIVETDRGQTKFVLNSEEDIRRLSVHTVQIVDATGVRFRVDDMRNLDRRSQQYIEWYV
ncbi:MAG: DUF1854 domain-containing protein [Pirellulales bacterium]